MENQKPAIESIRRERGRLRTVHEMLKEALAVSPRDETFIPFYIAIGDYMEASMGRLHIQDINMLERLASKIDMNDPENEEIIAEVYRRLDGNQEHLKRYSACKQALESEGAAAVTDYEDASLAYVDYIHNRMGHHAPSTDLARKAFTEEDWVALPTLTRPTSRKSGRFTTRCCKRGRRTCRWVRQLSSTSPITAARRASRRSALRSSATDPPLSGFAGTV